VDLDVVERTVALKRLPPFADSARIGDEVDMADCRTMLADDRTRFPLALRLKRVQRRWILLTGRRYESLIAERTTSEATR
jgi:hypothetical protein